MAESFYERFAMLAYENGYSSPTNAGIALGFSSSLVSSWKVRKSAPRFQTLKHIADHFGVSPQWLSGRDVNRDGSETTAKQETITIPAEHIEQDNTRTVEEPTVADYANAVLKFALFGDARNVTQEDIDDVLDYAKIVLMRKERRTKK